MAQRRYQFLDIYGVRRVWDYVCARLVYPVYTVVRATTSELVNRMDKIRTEIKTNQKELRYEYTRMISFHSSRGNEVAIPSTDYTSGYVMFKAPTMSGSVTSPYEGAEHDNMYLRINLDGSGDASFIVDNQRRKFAERVGIGNGAGGTILAANDGLDNIDNPTDAGYALDIRYIPRTQMRSILDAVLSNSDDKYVWQKYHTDFALDDKSVFAEETKPNGEKITPFDERLKGLPITYANMRDHDHVYLRLDGKEIAQEPGEVWEANGQYFTVNDLSDYGDGKKRIHNTYSPRVLSELADIAIDPHDVVNGADATWTIPSTEWKYPLDLRYYTRAQIAASLDDIWTFAKGVDLERVKVFVQLDQRLKEAERAIADTENFVKKKEFADYQEEVTGKFNENRTWVTNNFAAKDHRHDNYEKEFEGLHKEDSDIWTALKDLENKMGGLTGDVLGISYLTSNDIDGAFTEGMTKTLDQLKFN